MKGKWSAWPAMLGVVFLMLLILPAAARAEVTLQEWTIPTPNSQPHDIITDDQGIAWFTEIAANQIGRFDPFKQEFMEFPLPTMNGNPHGICVAPDNGIWFTEQGGNKIGRIDRDSFEITEFPLPNPNSGPHTPIYDGYGHIWFTQQSGNRIGRRRSSSAAILATRPASPENQREYSRARASTSTASPITSVIATDRK